MRTILETITAAEAELRCAPEYSERSFACWDDWFLLNTRYFRRVIGDLIMKSGDGFYQGEAGNHDLDLHEIFVSSDDGFRGLLTQWVACAKAVLADRQAVPA